MRDTLADCGVANTAAGRYELSFVALVVITALAGSAYSATTLISGPCPWKFGDVAIPKPTCVKASSRIFTRWSGLLIQPFIIAALEVNPNARFSPADANW